jgi:catechol 2,3-dioxygenase-like lactoylglutathione lyase family enzyme
MKIGFVTLIVTDFSKSRHLSTKRLGMETDYTGNVVWTQFKSGEDVSLAIQKRCTPSPSGWRPTI